MAERLPHLVFQQTGRAADYTAPIRKGGAKLSLKARDRKMHGEALIAELEGVQANEAEIIHAQKALGRDAGNGIYLQFESDPGFELAFESLGFAPSGIELLAVKEEEDGRMLASVYVPEGKLKHFFSRIEAYLDTSKDLVNKKGVHSPKYQELIESIAHVRLAVLDALWTDSHELRPQDDSPFWWEVWLRCGEEFDEVGFFRAHASQFGMKVAKDELRFLERCVVLVFANRDQMAASLQLLLGIAELRRAKERADWFSNMGSQEQSEWVASTAGQLNSPNPGSPMVCLLDTGVNHHHPLLKPFISDSDRDSIHPSWGKHDHHPQGHGTAMAGLALHGDLSEKLWELNLDSPGHGVVSIKILPPNSENNPRLYGDIYCQAVSRAEVIAPHRPRVFCSAVATTDGRDRGRPSSWSAELDKISSGMEDGSAHLIIQAAGNAARAGISDYPTSNATDPVHDPGQAWNILTVGYYSEKWQFDIKEYPERRLIAMPGSLGPTSCTGLEWPIKGRQKWPNKPDVVMEGGNWVLDTTLNFPEDLDSLQLLSTGHEPLTKPLVTFGETSAATALAARFAARLLEHYPEFWPETIRALIVHSARWTQTMRESVGSMKKKAEVRKLLRTVGYGVPDLNEALWSARNALTLIVQDELQPYDVGVKGVIRTRDIHYHELPWPVEALHTLPPETKVEMRVTLSYFIQPNPGDRGWSGRFSYASHGLRFRVKAPEESHTAFERRINSTARDDEYERSGISDSDHWVIGSDTRELGSIHSDYWEGTAAQLANCGYLAVYPVMGWWRTRKALNRWHLKARYALIVTLRTPDQSVDIYTSVATRVGVGIST